MEFTVDKNKDFRKDIEIIFDNLKKGNKFSFSKYADGEYAILRNIKIRNCDNWEFVPEIHQAQQKQLLDSFVYSDDGYYIGLSCPCCVDINDVTWMRNTIKSKPENTTWANIFVNGNYNYFKDNFIPEFNNHDIIIVAYEKANTNQLPFKVQEHIPITMTGWYDNFDLVESLPKKDYENKLFLFCAGPLGNMLAHKMWEENKKNIYIDIGSTLNPWLVGNNRGYLRGSQTLNKKCIW